MKINEIVQEGILDTVKSYIPGTQAQKARVAQSTGQKQAQKQAQFWVQKWNKAVGANPALKNDAGALQRYGQQLARGSNGESLFTVDAPANMTPTGVNQYITDIVSRAESQATATPTDTTQPATEPAGAPGQSSTLDPQQQAQQKLASIGAKIVSSEPIVVDFKNGHYGLNDKGQWYHMKSGKVPPEAMQALLGQIHDTHLDSQQSSTAAAPAPSASAAEPVTQPTDWSKYDRPTYLRKQPVKPQVAPQARNKKRRR